VVEGDISIILTSLVQSFPAPAQNRNRGKLNDLRRRLDQTKRKRVEKFNLKLPEKNRKRRSRK
jgi:hypothetical protein